MGKLMPLDNAASARQFEAGVHVGFEIIRAENGAWILSDFDPYLGRSRRHACANDVELVAQMRAWMDRAIANFEKSQAAPLDESLSQ